MATPSLGAIFGEQEPEADATVIPEQPETGQAKGEEKGEEKAEAAPEEKPAEVAPKKEEKAEAKPEPTREEAKPEAKAEAKEEDKPKPEINWEDEANPFVKRYRDAGSWANRVHQENLALKKQVRDLGVDVKKLNGTYDPEVDGKPEVDPDQAIAMGERFGRGTASLRSAYEQHGAEKVDTELAEFNRLFDGDNYNEIVQMRVLKSPMPVMEAMQVMDEYRFTQKHGRNSTKIIENLRKEWEAEELPKLREQVTQEIMVRVRKQEKEVKGLGDAREAVRGSNKRPYQSPSLDQIFNE